jgi:hypothetical protein
MWRRLGWAAAVCLGLSLAAFGQERRASPETPDRPVTMADGQAREFVLDALRRGLPEELRPSLYQLAATRSVIIVPEFVAALEMERKRPSPRTELMDMMADIVASAADEKAVEGLVALATSDLDRFSPALLRVFDYARGRQNPFLLAHHAIGKGNAQIDSQITQWVVINVEGTEGYRLLAEAVEVWHRGRALDDLVREGAPFLVALPDERLRRLDTQLRTRRAEQSGRNE